MHFRSSNGKAGSTVANKDWKIQESQSNKLLREDSGYNSTLLPNEPLSSLNCNVIYED